MEHVFEEDVCESIVFFDTFGGSGKQRVEDCNVPAACLGRHFLTPLLIAKIPYSD